MDKAKAAIAQRWWTRPDCVLIQQFDSPECAYQAHEKSDSCHQLLGAQMPAPNRSTPVLLGSGVDEDDVIADFNSDVGVAITLVKDGEPEWGYKIDAFVHGLSDADWAEWDITAPHHAQSWTLIKHNIYQPFFMNGESGYHGGFLTRVNKDGSQWKMMALGRTCPKDHCVDAVFNKPGTCEDPEHAPRVTECCDRAYGQSFPNGDGTYDEDQQYETWVADRDDMVRQQIAATDNPQWNEIHGMGVSPTDLAGILYPMDGAKRQNKAWNDELQQNPPQWAVSACQHLKGVHPDKPSEWPVYQYTIRVDDKGEATQDLKKEYEHGGDAAELAKVGHVTC